MYKTESVGSDECQTRILSYFGILYSVFLFLGRGERVGNSDSESEELLSCPTCLSKEGRDSAAGS